jgi:hypothetical protein
MLPASVLGKLEACHRDRLGSLSSSSILPRRSVLMGASPNPLVIPDQANDRNDGRHNWPR